MDLKMAESHLSLKMLYRSVAGVMVSIAAFQAVDPGSIPGPRIFFLSEESSLGRVVKAHA